MKELDESDDDINEIIKEDKYNLFYFTATWCGPCKRCYPSLCKLDEGLEDICFYKIDIEKNEEFCENIKSVPTFRLYKNGKLLDECSSSNITKVGKLIKNNIN